MYESGLCVPRLLRKSRHWVPKFMCKIGLGMPRFLYIQDWGDRFLYELGLPQWKQAFRYGHENMLFDIDIEIGFQT